MSRSNSCLNTLVLRLELKNKNGVLANVMKQVADANARVVGVDMVAVTDSVITRDITLSIMDEQQSECVIQSMEGNPDVKLLRASDRTFLLHLGGKIEVMSKIGDINKKRADLQHVYTPNVAKVCMAIHEEPEVARNLTIKGNTVAIVTDGSAVLGLGNIGPEAAMPVMEGKAMLMKSFAGVNAFPICLNTQDVDEIVRMVELLEPTFGAINLEDIAAPRCFEIEKRLQKSLNIPVFHDDQHGTAIVMLAAFQNALKVVNKKASEVKVVINGTGAAGTACKDILIEYGVSNIIGCDRYGAIAEGRDDLDDSKRNFLSNTNPNHESGLLSEVIKGADVFIGLSAGDVLTVEDVKSMADDSIVFAMANPNPEIKPELAMSHVAVMATGRSDYPNQINNVLAFPGIFKGALACKSSDISMPMMLAAADAIAGIIDESALTSDYIIPSVFDEKVVPAVSQAIIKLFEKEGQ